MEPEYWTCDGASGDAFQGIIVTRATALCAERLAIRHFCHEGRIVVNMTHNRQYIRATGLLEWEVADARWCVPMHRASRVANVLPSAA